MKSSNHCTGEQYIYTGIFLSFTGRFQTLIQRFKKHIPPYSHAEEKESITTVWSKVPSEHANLANGRIFNGKTLQNLHTKVANDTAEELLTPLLKQLIKTFGVNTVLYNRKGTCETEKM